MRTIHFEAHSVGTEYSLHLKNKAFSKFWPNNNDSIMYYHNKSDKITKKLERNLCLPHKTTKVSFKLCFLEFVFP